MKYQPSSQGGALRTRILVLVVLILVALGLLAASFFGQKSEQSPPNSYRAATDRFVSLISHKDGLGSYSLMTDRFKTKIGALSSWRNQLDTSFGKSTGSPQYIDSIQPKGPSGQPIQDQYWVIYTFKLTGNTWRSYILAIKDGNDWRIDGMESRAY